jgi:hypothetical protein
MGVFLQGMYYDLIIIAWVDSANSRDDGGPTTDDPRLATWDMTDRERGELGVEERQPSSVVGR